MPFRDSKLTYLLQGVFTGEGKILMMANLSPSSESSHESLSTLRFAQKVHVFVQRS